MSLKFLNLKGWHPSNKANQKKIWIAEQEAIQRERSEKEAAAEALKQQDLLRFKQIAAAKGDKETIREIDAQTMGFMYAAPPGLQQKAATIDGEEETDVIVDGNDKAAQDFRKRMTEEPKNAYEAVSTLERSIGRRAYENVTIAEQVERFPFLKDAPVVGDYATTVQVNFKPLGRQIRNTRCIRCQEWGHQTGDRECRLRDHNPLEADRQVREDPVTLMKKMRESDNNLVMNKSALPVQMTCSSAAKYDLLFSEDEDSDPEKRYLASLSTKEKKKLLKKLREEDDSKKKKKKRKHESSESKKKHKTKRD